LSTSKPEGVVAANLRYGGRRQRRERAREQTELVVESDI
jgi:hypothetical protein